MISTLKHVTSEVIKEIEDEMRVRRTREIFLLFPLGSQTDKLIKDKIDKLGVYCLVADPASVSVEDVKKIRPIGIILSGGPVSAHIDPPPFDKNIFDLNIPVFGICLGLQLFATHKGVKVALSPNREFGIHTLKLTAAGKKSPLFKNCHGSLEVLQNHGDRIAKHKSLEILGETTHSVAAISSGNFYGVQFHPEVAETKCGEELFKNFCFGICHAQDVFPAEDLGKHKIEALKVHIGTKKVLLALSGGSDSSVVAYLLKGAMGKGGKERLRGVYIKGIDRPDDEAFVLKFFGKKDWIDLKIVDATEDFLKALSGAKGMHDKRLAMRGVYKKILEDEAKNFSASFIAQGTLYTDLSESGLGLESGAKKAQIKLHHNTSLDFSIPEISPLDDCVKDGARNIGRSIGVPEALLMRHPFPGPGLLVRIEGEVTAEKLRIARAIDGIWIEELRQSGFYEKVWQAGAVVTRAETTCVKGDGATMGNVIMIWAVTSVNGFTAQAAELPYEFLKKVERRMTSEIREVGSVSYRISGKPPSTIEIG